MNPVRVIGIGNEWRGDDGAGLAVARRLAALSPPGMDVLESGGEPLSLMDLWQGAARVVLVDAMQSDLPPGEVTRFDATEKPLPTGFFRDGSTHAFGLPEAIELARSLGRLPEAVTVYGIQAANLDHGRALSLPVQRTVEDLCARIVEEIGA